MRAIYSLVAVLALVLVAWVGSGAGLQYLFGVVIPYAAFLVFLAGFTYKVVSWARSPVPYRIPTTAGQQYSLPWIKQNKFDNPSTTGQTVVRMLLEVFAFRTLFRNTRMELHGDRVVYGSTKWLWMFGLIFHWAFFIVLFRHMRLFLEPVPGLVGFAETLDSLFQITVPALYLTDGLLLFGVTALFVRRVMSPQLKYASLMADYFPLFLIGAIAFSGVVMRYITKIDVEGVKRLTMGLVTMAPVIPDSVTPVFYVHLFLVSILLVYFPFSKLMHAGGVFLSPTRNLPNNNRMVRHVNPWNPPLESLHFMSYEMWEDEFREKMREADMPLDKE